MGTMDDALAALEDVPSPLYGVREDGTPKGKGFFGELPSKDPKFPKGAISTELSSDSEVDGERLFFPLLVPTLTRDEIDSLLAGDKPSDAIYDKAIAHAQQRIAQGKSPFAGVGEQRPLPESRRAPGTLDDALSILNQAEQADHLKGNGALGLKKNPAASTKVLQLYGKTGLPKDFIERNADFVEQEAAKADFNPDKLMKESPAFASWLAEHPDHVAAAKPDLSKLSYLERQWRHIQNAAEVGPLLVELADLGNKSFNETITPRDRQRQAEIEKQLDILGRSEQDNDITGFFEGIPAAVVEQAPIFLRSLKGKVEYAGKGVAAGTVGGALVGSAAGPAGTVAGATGGGVAIGLAGWRYGAAIEAGKLELGHALLDYEKLKDEHGNPLDRTTIKGLALMAGTINGALEGLTGLEALANKLPGVRNIVRGGVKELLRTPTARRVILGMAKDVGDVMVTEGVTEAMQMYVTKAGGELAKWATDGGSPTEVLGRIFSREHFEEAKAEFVKGAQSGGGTSMVLAAPSVVQDLQQVRRATQNQRAFQAMGEAAESSQFAKDLPDHLKEIIQRSTDQGPIETLYVPPESFTQYWQSQGADPRAVYRELTGEADAYDQSVETGQPLPIKTADYASKLAGTPHNEFFSQELKTSIDQMNAREAAEWSAMMDEQAQAAAQQPGLEASAITDPTAKIRQDILGQLQAAGFDPAVADKYAALVAERYATRAERRGLGEDPSALFRKLNLQVSTQLPEILRTLGSQQTELDALLNRLRTGDLPKESEVFGQSLTEFLREKGGVQDQGGELSALGVDEERKAFRKNLIQKGGQSLDDAATSAFEAGYITSPDIADLLPALEKDARQSPVYAIGKENARLLDVLNNIESLRDWLAARDIDIQSTPNEWIKALLGEAVHQPLPGVEGETFAQGDTITVDGVERPTTNSNGQPIAQTTEALENFWKWFGDSQVVDDQGRPIVVYHGTGAKFSTFNKKKTTQGLIWFTSNRAAIEAGEVGAQGKGFIMEIYAKIERPADWKQYDKLGLYEFKREGLDGAVLKEEDGTFDGFVFESSQLKSVKNKGTFDATKANILFQGGANVDEATAVLAKEFPGVDFFLSAAGYDSSLWTLRNLVVAKENRKQGVGSRFMERLTELADQQQATILLTAAQPGDNKGTTSKGRLIEFYRRFGFVHNKGRNKDYRYTDTMYRRPELHQGAGSSDSAQTPPEPGRVTKDPYSEIQLNPKTGMFYVYRGAAAFGTELDHGQYFTVDITLAQKYANQARPYGDVQRLAVDFNKLIDTRSLPVDATPEDFRKFYRDYGIDESYEFDVGKTHRVTYAENDTGLIDFAQKHGFAGYIGHEAGKPNVLLTPKAYRQLFKSGDIEGRDAVESGVWDGEEVPPLPNPSGPQEGGPLFQSDRAPKGSITFGTDSVSIQLLEKADKSTFIHETGHLWLNELIDDATTEGTPQQLKDDLDTLLKWFGLDVISASGKDAIKAAIETKHHEQFARGFEAYAMEGKAPSLSLRDIFSTFRQWLIQVYRSLITAPLNVKLTNDVREVMDRMIATDEAIDQAANEADVLPSFTTAESAGMSKAQWNAYQDLVRKASATAREQLQAKLMRQYQREQEAWWKEKRKEMRASVTDEVNDLPEYTALAVLKTGKMPDGSDIPHGIEPMKLDRKGLLDGLGKDILSRLPKGLAAKNGMHHDAVAQLFGYTNGQDFVLALVNARPKDELIEAETDRRMREEYGDIRFDGTLAERAQEAVLNENQEKVIEAELKAIAAKRREISPFLKATEEERKQKQAEGKTLLSTMVPTLKDTRELARSIMARTAIKNVNANAYSVAARQASRKATAALVKQDWVEAGHYKQQELLNLALFREAGIVKERIEKARDMAKGFFRTDKDLAKSRNVDLVNVGRAILAQYGFGKADKTAAEYLEPIKTYDQDLYDQWKPQVDALAPQQVPYNALTVEEFTKVADDLESLWMLSRRTQQVKIGNQLFDRDQIVDELTNRIAVLGKGERSRILGDPTPWEDAKLGIMSFRSALRRVESWVDAMDGGNPDGAFRKYIWGPIQDAAVTFRSEKSKLLKDYLQLIQPIEKDLTHDLIPANELGYGFSFRGKAALLHAVLHSGNESNKSKLLRGYGWGEAAFDQFLMRMQSEGVLTKADYDYVQGVWDLLESVKPDAQRAHHEMYGYYFNEITAKPFQTIYGEYRGGYVPAIADAVKSVDQAVRQDKELFDQAGNSFMFPTTGRGFTKSRVEQYAAPLALNLATIPIHLDKVMRFVHLEPRVKDAARLVTNKRLRASLDEMDPTVAKDMLVPWLQRSAQQKVSTPGKNRHMDRVWKYLRSTTGGQVMVANVVNTLQQFTGFSLSLTKVKAKYLRGGLVAYLKGPSTLAESIHEKSPYMAQRLQTQVMEIQSSIDDILLNPTKYEKAKDFMKRHGYFMQEGTQNIVDLITWSGAYDQAIEKGADEKQAVREADAAVRQTQGSFEPESLSAFEAGTPFTRAFTMFYSYFNMQANLLGTEFQKVSQGMGLKKGAGRAFYLYFVGFMIPAVMAEAIIAGLGGFDPDDDDDYLNETLSTFFNSQIRTALAMVPGVGPVALAGINAFNRRWYDDRISTSPVISVMESAVSAPHSVYKAIAEEGRAKRAVRDVLTLLGVMTGLPVAALNRPAGYLADVYDGVAKPDDVFDVTRGLISGRDVNRIK